MSSPESVSDPDSTGETQAEHSTKSALRPPAHISFPNIHSILKIRPASLDEILNSCVVVPDTNALLLPFGISGEHLKKIEEQYQRLINEQRLKVPAQVIREFVKNRTKTIGSLIQRLKSRTSFVPKEIQGHPILRELDGHTELREAEQEMRKQAKKHKEATTKLLTQITAWECADPVTDLYAKLFTDAVIIQPTIADDAIDLDIEHRMTHSIPPGYMDSAKEDGGGGDIRIWHTILDFAETHDKHVLFVSGEKKEDWWEKADDKTLLSPRIELLEEFHRRANGKTFRIIELSALLKHLKVDPNVIDEVKAEEAREQYPPSRFNAHQQAMIRWLVSRGATRINECSQYDFGVDFSYILPDGRTGYLIFKVMDTNTARSDVIDQMLRDLTLDTQLEHLEIALIARSPNIAIPDRFPVELFDMYERGLSALYLGHIENGTYQMVRRFSPF